LSVSHFDFAAHKRDLVSHYADLLADPGWNLYVKKRLVRLSQEIPDLWGDMPDLVKAEAANRPANYRMWQPEGKK
jgi:hypothetical protein